MASRSVTVVLKNASSSHIYFASGSLSGGEWDTSLPPSIPPGTLVAWTSQSDGFMTGTQGTASFNLSAGLPVILTVNWDNPFYGSNSYSASATPPFNVGWQGGGGDNAVVVFNFS